MEPVAPMFEQILMYAGHAICVMGAMYMIKLGEVKVGAVLFIGFVLQVQAGMLGGLMDLDPEEQGTCWAAGGSYYECLPILFRITIHLGQIGTVLVGVGVFLAARSLARCAGSS
jgi:hypothetical protein